MKTPTTDEMDRTTPEERKALRGYCEPCGEWHNFIDGKDPRNCPNCGSKFSNRQGQQITSQRTPMTTTAKRKTRRQ